MLEFASNLVIIDKIVATSKETKRSNYVASDYIDAYFNISGIDDTTRARIIANYSEANPYYLLLQTQYGIEPAIARTAKHLTILKAMSNCLSQSEEELFYDCYYESLNYYNNVIHTKAFNFHDREPNFTKVFLIWSTIMKFITRAMESVFDIDKYDARMLKNSFISLGLDYFDGMPINYQRALLKKIHDIISNKGDTQCFIDILSVFGEDTVEICNYYLVKKYNKAVDENTGTMYYVPSLEFYKTPFREELDINSNEYIDFTELTINDRYWKATKEELLNKDFNVVKTDYLSVNSALDIYNNTLVYSYFFNYLQKAIANKKLESTNIYYTRVSPRSYNIFEAFVAVMSIAMKLNGYTDKIIDNVDVTNYVFGYAEEFSQGSSEYIEVRELLQEIEDTAISDNQLLAEEKNNIIAFVRNYSVERLTAESYSLTELLKLFYANESIRKDLEKLMTTTNNYHIRRALERLNELEMRTTCNVNLFKGYSTYTEYLKYNNADLYNYVQIPNSENPEELYFLLKEKLNNLIASINEQLYNDELGNAISRNTFSGLNNYLDYYIKTLIHLFKPYGMTVINDTDLFIYNTKTESIRVQDEFNRFVIKSFAEGMGTNDRLEIYNKGVKLL